MDKRKIKSEIFINARALAEKLPEKVWEKMLLTGGGAAFLMGSDRPFSHDVDFLVPKNTVPEIEKTFGIRFEYHEKKPVFHSFKGVINAGGSSFDLIAESVVEPEGYSQKFSFFITDEILSRKTIFKEKGFAVHVIPPELLILIKLLAGRGKELNKYDLFDAVEIFSHSEDFDIPFFISLVREFCRPLKKSIPFLKERIIAAESETGKTGALFKLSEALLSH